MCDLRLYFSKIPPDNFLFSERKKRERRIKINDSDLSRHFSLQSICLFIMNHFSNYDSSSCSVRYQNCNLGCQDGVTIYYTIVVYRASNWGEKGDSIQAIIFIYILVINIGDDLFWWS